MNSHRLPHRSSVCLLVGFAGVTCFALLGTARRGGRIETVKPPVSLQPASMQGFRTAVYQSERLRLRIAGDSLVVSHPKLFGPFSLGFAHTLVGHNVTVETFPAGDVPEASALGSLGAIPAALAQQHSGFDIVGAELAPIKVVERRGNDSRVILTAASCALAFTSTEWS